ncbi:MAG TPA: ABC transporter permease, partial [Thermoanaerobaculia bacterium]|nr:ABC transporter permease [Thermoanaerobaculia bacterium]
MEGIARDLRLAARALTRTPGFLAAVVVTLALGLGVTTAIFSVVNAILLRPVPGREPQRLVNVHRTAPDGTSFHGFSYPDLLDLRAGGGKVFSA